MMKLVLGQFNDSFPPVLDGVANVVKNYSYWLNKKYGYCCTVTPYAPKYKDNEEFEVLRYASIPVPGRYPYRAGVSLIDRKVKQKLDDIPFDLIHAHSPFSAGQLSLRIGRQRDIPVVATFHSKFYDDFLDVVKSRTIASTMTKYVIHFFNKADYVWTLNQGTLDTLRSYGYKGDAEIVPNGIDFTVENTEEGKLHSQRAPMKQGQPFEFLFVGQQIWHKNIRLLVNSLQLVKEWGIPFRMTMVGEGNASDEIKQLVNELGLTGQFRFTGRINDRQELKNIYSKAHIFLFPSIYDNFGLVIGEAAAAGCPSLLIRNSNTAGNIVDGFNGLLADNDVSEYALAIKAAVSNPQMLLDIGTNASKTLTRSWESIVDEVALRYQDIIKDYKAGMLKTV